MNPSPLPEGLERNFGWSWLLPLGVGYSVYLDGFDDAECAFWRNKFGASVLADDPCQADCWIIHVDHAHAGLVDLMSSEGAKARWVALIGSGKSISYWKRHLPKNISVIREYGLLPASDPRLVIPLGRAHQAACALALHRPGRKMMQIAIWIAEKLARMGFLALLRRNLLLFAAQPQIEWPLGAIQAEMPTYIDEEPLDYALYMGTPDNRRKTVVLPIGNSVPDHLIKMGDLPMARQALRNEGAALTILSDSILRMQVPQLKRMVENQHGISLYLEYRARCRVGKGVLEKAIVEFLVKLSMLDRQCRPLREVLHEVVAESPWISETVHGKGFAMAELWLAELAKQGAMIWEHRAHGDFAQWNYSWTSTGFYVYDWEESNSQALAFSDAFYCSIAPMLYIKDKVDIENMVHEAIALASQVAVRAGFEKPDLRVHFVLWAISKCKNPQFSAIGARLIEHALAGWRSIGPID